MSDEIEYVLEPGPIAGPRRSADENAQLDWNQILAVSKMLDDRVYAAGAKIRITRSPIFPHGDHKALMREYFSHWLDRILATAELVDP